MKISEIWICVSSTEFDKSGEKVEISSIDNEHDIIYFYKLDYKRNHKGKEYYRFGFLDRDTFIKNFKKDYTTIKGE